MTVTRKSNPLSFDYHIGDTTLTHVRKEKDLGCIITSHLTWDQQVLDVVCKPNKMLGLSRSTARPDQHESAAFLVPLPSEVQPRLRYILKSGL